MNNPAVLAQAGRRHERGQAVAFPGRSGDDRGAAGPPGGLAGAGGDQPLADRAGPVLLGNGNPARFPVVADPAQRGRDDVLAQADERHAGRQPFEAVACLRFVPRGDQRVQALGLRGPVADVDGPDGFPAKAAAGGERPDLTVIDLVTPSHLAGRKDALAHPAVGGLVVHAEGPGGLAQVHPSSRLSAASNISVF